MLPCSLIEKVLILDTIAVATKKLELQRKNREAARNLLQEIQRSQVSYVTTRKNTSEEQ